MAKVVAAWLADVKSRIGAVGGGRSTYEAAGHRGGQNPWGPRLSACDSRPSQPSSTIA